ncbi:SDR family NAD(P)-dependent oxidoreductase [Asticcacaulis sp. EMRT-3]|uniref:SDR family NAD(P)-dependent oxidoreductase n=1 Tax=Asticcacaulis sp. EMRT-3 TaxID=3040349 RepID=UPI0024AF3080|nr:SDR family NAD(P)-dependent oxidoreductase [Asticcacaulis sp. EMRT-3]MDI7773944.1 SDR family NAD(P)-dependent oxidoreductase [Asticcacaulis sp. EMRT-3]
MSLSNYRLLRFLARLVAPGRKVSALPLPDPSDPDSFKVLLHRPQVRLDTERMRHFYAGKRIMVTGAGGSIGSEIAKQVLGLGAAHVTLVDHSELALYEIDRAIREGFEGARARPVLCSVRRKERFAAVVAEAKPDVIFHAAALKHVPMVELNPSESVLTNVLGTQYVIDAAKAAGVSQLVLISSDKAVAPSSLMGATKRLAEHLISTQITQEHQACVVRFGNVLGSTGSVVPLFKSQIERGGPITLTDKDAERYFMTIFEAVQLVLTAAMHNAETPEHKSGLYILEMGAPIRIFDLATRMIRLYGLRPEKDIAITFTGLRAGEKITEALIDDNEMRHPLLPGIFEVANQTYVAPIASEIMQTLYALAQEGHDEQAKTMVFNLVKSLRNQPEPALAANG